jgi:hypothetical protein
MTKSSPTNDVLAALFAEHVPQTVGPPLPVKGCSPIDDGSNGPADRAPPHQLPGYATPDLIHPAVEISPPDFVARRAVTGHGMAAESVQCTSQGNVNCRFRAPIIYSSLTREVSATTERHSSKGCLRLSWGRSHENSLLCQPAMNTTNGSSRARAQASCISTSILRSSRFIPSYVSRTYL